MLAISPAAPHLLAVAAGACVAVFDSAARREAAVLRSQTSNRPIAAVAWSPDGSFLLAGEGPAGGGGASGTATVHVWDLQSCACVKQLRGQHRHGVAALRFSPDGASARAWFLSWKRGLARDRG
jgi:WD40 repeat protein